MRPFLFRPIKPWIVTQHFGEGKDLYTRPDGVTVHAQPPVPKDWKKFYKDGHTGLDILLKRWQPIYCAYDGVVQYVETDASLGLGVVVLSKIGNKYFNHRYWHMIALNVHKGEQVKVGSFLGYGDSTGHSTGDHLHFGFKWTDRFGNTLNKDNGSLGGVDPEPLFYPVFAMEHPALVRQLFELTAQLFDKLSDMLRGQ